MRLPTSPPEWLPLMVEATKKGLSTEFYSYGQEESRNSERYLHWDEFRRRVSPSHRLTIEERWAAIRMTRSVRSQPIDLRDSQGRNFTFSLTQKAFELLHGIDLHCGGSMSVAEEGIVQDQTRDRYYISSLFEEALTSSQLEGAVVTRSEAREIIHDKRKPANPHEKMVVNNYLTMRLVNDLKDTEMSKDLILKIHRAVTAGTMDNPEDEGRFRTASDDVRIEDEESGEIIHVPPPAALLGSSMDAFCKFANQRGMNGFLHPVVRSILLHFWIAYDHPFTDGNGRTARAMFYWSMLRHGFWLAEFFSISHEILKAPKQYYRAFLHAETDGNDLNYFIIHQLQVIKNSISALRDYIERKRTELEKVRQFLGPQTGLNQRQLSLIKHALKHPYASYTIAGHQSSSGVSYQTSLNDLTELETKQLLKKHKVGKAFVFNAVPDLSSRLSRPQ